MAWDDDSEDEGDNKATVPKKPASVTSSTTIQPATKGLLKPEEKRKSNDEKSHHKEFVSAEI